MRAIWARALATLLLLALPFEGGAGAEGQHARLLAHFHNALGTRVFLGRAQRVKIGKQAAAEPYAVGARSRAFSAFTDQWRRVAPHNVTPFYVGGSGSEVNNVALYEIARQGAKRRAESEQGGLLVGLGRTFHSWRGTVEPGFIAFGGAFVARNGVAAAQGFQRLKEGRGAPAGVIESPLHQRLDTSSGPLDYAERRALSALAKRLSRTSQLGAVLLEPIPSAYGVLFYRKRFVEALRQLCDAKQVALVFDETYTAGGITGKFFAYEHYGVEPDFVVFGKGTLPGGAGVARVDRGRVSWPVPASLVGFKSTPGVLHHGTKVLATLADHRLIEKVAAKGARLRAGLEAKARLGASQGESMHDGRDGRREGGKLRGIGLLLHAGSLTVDGKPLGRIAPHLTITDALIDQLVDAVDGSVAQKIEDPTE